MPTLRKEANFAVIKFTLDVEQGVLAFRGGGLVELSTNSVEWFLAKVTIAEERWWKRWYT